MDLVLDTPAKIEAALDLSKIMTPERVLGALIWSVWHGELPNELIALVDTLTPEYITSLAHEGSLDMLVQITQGANLDPKVRPYLIAGLRDEIVTTIDPDFHRREQE